MYVQCTYIVRTAMYVHCMYGPVRPKNFHSECYPYQIRMYGLVRTMYVHCTYICPLGRCTQSAQISFSSKPGSESQGAAANIAALSAKQRFFKLETQCVKLERLQAETDNTAHELDTELAEATLAKVKLEQETEGMVLNPNNSEFKPRSHNSHSSLTRYQTSPIIGPHRFGPKIAQ